MPSVRLVAAGLVSIPAVLIPVSAFAQALFLRSEAFPYDGAPATELAVADLDLDGRLDAVVAGEQATPARIHVFLGRQGPSFAAPLAFPGRQSAVALALGPIDDDPYPDVVVANSGSVISVYLNAGDGTLRSAENYQMGISPRSLGLGDFNNDGSMDVAGGTLLEREVHVLFGDGLGVLGFRTTVAIADDPHALAAADFDGDGVSDLIVPQSVGVGFYRSLGNGSFANPILVSSGGPRHIAAGDLDGNGLSDFTVTNSLDNSVDVLFRKDNGFFEKQRIDVLRFPARVAVSDADADGELDLVTQRTVNDASVLFQVYSNLSNGRFASPVEQRLDIASEGLVLADLDGDGATDVLFTRADEPQLRVYRAPARGELSLRGLLTLEERPADVLKLRGRAAPALIAVSARKLHVLRPDPAGRLVVSRVVDLASSAFVDAEAADFDGDGIGELALADAGRNQAVIVSLDANDGIGDLASHALAGLPAKLSAADVDLDGLNDLAVADLAHPAITVILGPLMEADPRVLQVPMDAGQKSLVVSDLNGDGAADIAASLEAGLHVLLGDGSGRFTAAGAVNVPGMWELRAADLDRDGAMDLTGTTGSSVVALLGAASGQGMRRVEIPFPSSQVRALDVFDVDLDGDLDLLVGTSEEIQVIRNSGAGAFSGPEEYLGAGKDPRAIVVEDLDGDGSLDAAVAAYQSTGVAILPGSLRPSFRRGDTNGDGGAGLTDAVVILDSLFRGGGELPCPDAGDVDDSGRLELTDAVYLLLHLFQGGPEPPAPGASACGTDPTTDELGACRTGC